MMMGQEPGQEAGQEAVVDNELERQGQLVTQPQTGIAYAKVRKQF